MERKIDCLSLQFNVAVLHMAGIMAPLGYVPVDNDDAPQTLQELKLHVHRLGGVIPVSKDYSDTTIFGDPEINYASRAWHDAVHLQLNADFTPSGDYRVFVEQVRQLLTRFPYDENTKKWIEYLHADIVGQIKHQKVYGMFPLNQIQFVREYIEYGNIVFTGNPY